MIYNELQHCIITYDDDYMIRCLEALARHPGVRAGAGVHREPGGPGARTPEAPARWSELHQ